LANGKAIRPYILHKRQKKIIECVLVEEWSGPFDSHLPRVVHWKVKFSLFYQKMIFFRSKKSCHSLQAKHKLKEIKWLRGQLWQFLLGRSFESLTIFLVHFLAFFRKKRPLFDFCSKVQIWITGGRSTKCREWQIDWRRLAISKVGSHSETFDIQLSFLL
jgi:hypothetical protein